MHRPRIERRIRHSFSGNLCLSVGFFTRLLRPARHSVPPDVSSRLYRTEHCTAAETQFVVALYVRMCWRAAAPLELVLFGEARFARCVVKKIGNRKALRQGQNKDSRAAYGKSAGSVLFAVRCTGVRLGGLRQEKSVRRKNHKERKWDDCRHEKRSQQPQLTRTYQP